MNAKCCLFTWFTVLSLAAAAPVKGEICQGKAEFNIETAADGRVSTKPDYVHAGRTFIEGRRGEPYFIHFKNKSPNRVLVVVSVDGLDVLEGKTATTQSGGYVVEAHQSLDIKGWRTSTSEVRQFYFDGKGGSYAAGTGHDTNNCGVIACKVFAEKPPVIFSYAPPKLVEPLDEFREHPVKSDGDGRSLALRRRIRSASGELAPPAGASTAPTPLSAASAMNVPEFRLGTGWGAPVRDCVREVAFERAEELTTITLYYSDAESLERIGIALHPKPAASPGLPQAFAEFCPPPKGRD